VYIAAVETAVSVAVRLGLTRGEAEDDLGSKDDDFPAVGYKISQVVEALARNDLRLPMEVEWVYMAATIWNKTGSAVAMKENIIDRSSPENVAEIDQLGLDDQDVGHDGFPGRSPVGACGSSGNGFYDVFGNVSELCADDSLAKVAGLNLESRVRPSTTFMMVHGGSFQYPLSSCAPGVVGRVLEPEHKLLWYQGFRVAHDP
jgi:formylglycine-generating enzyme required for sulfatase activity